MHSDDAHTFELVRSSSPNTAACAEHIKQEAVKIVGEVRRLHDHGVPWHEMAILLRAIKYVILCCPTGHGYA